MESLSQTLADWGYWGLFFSAFIAGSILPFSSEAVMIVLVHMGLDPVLCVAAASLGNTLGGMSCYWIGTLGKSEWVTRLGVSEKQLARARRFLSGRGALMAFFAFLPTIGEAIASGCASVGALGGKLKCGTNCGSCVPELNALLAAQRTRA